MTGSSAALTQSPRPRTQPLPRASMTAMRAQLTTFARHGRLRTASSRTRLAYGEAIKAIEAAAIPVLLPNDRTATLGKILGTLKQKPETIVFAIGDGDASAVIGMMRAVWDGHSDRHGSTTTKRVGDEAASAAVHLAVTLVQLFRQGSIRTK